MYKFASKSIDKFNEVQSLLNRMVIIFSLTIILLPIIICESLLPIRTNTFKCIETRAYLSCNGEPAKNIKIVLLNKNMFNRTSTINQTFTNRVGEFSISGRISLFNVIRPYIGIAHQCNEPNRFCFNVITFTLPRLYISKYKFPIRQYNLGKVELNKIYSNQKIYCKNNIKKKIFKSKMKL
uniref:Transthyretin-like family-containing protein n=1 Tax=Strongyloides stercoralis TaxID=6248 RepID=A0A0K0ERP5_STRER